MVKFLSNKNNEGIIMKFKYSALMIYLLCSFTKASDVEDACFNCPPLDKVADATNFDEASYYANAHSAISNNLSAEEIKNAISGIISTNHKNLTYSEVWTALTKTDEDPSNTDNVILLYRGLSLPKFSNGSGTQSSDPDNWNREHVWAKSHGFSSSSLEAYTDIHHLRPTDISVNSSRGNLDFDNSDSPLSEAPANRVDSDSFEPRDSVKGDVARMVLYMDTRYQGLDSTPDLTVVDRLTTTGEPALGLLCRMLEWHAADIVDETEQTRNDRIFEFQGNRNPFIDHPEWVSKLYQADACSGGGDTGGGDDGGDDGSGGDDDGDTTPTPTAASLIISEYIEGSSYNKAIELFNLSNEAIDLAAENYKLGRFSNGGTEASMITLEGSIAAQSTFVIANSRASDAIKALADQQSGSVSHNGDDGYVLYKNDEVIDSFGRIGQDPGSAWGVDSFSTKDNSLQRNSSVIQGDTVIDDDFDPATEWTGSGKDNIDDLGQHTVINPEIFISEYIEGGSYNKALELYNPASTEVNLLSSNYQLGRYTNGSTEPTLFALDGVISAQSTYVIAHTSAASAILTAANQLTANIAHNGDDAYVLFKDGVVIDSIGRVGEDPGSEWGSGSESTKDNTLVRKASITQGDTVIDDEFSPAVEWNGFAKDTFDYIGTHDANGEVIEPVASLGVCQDPATLIHQIQGVDDISLLAGENHIVEAVVTAVFPALNGFFIQEESTDHDADSATSEGLFVLNSANTITPTQGDVVRILGSVSEYFGKTQLTATQDLLQCGTAEFSATILTLPFDSVASQEALEGMYVTIVEPLTITDNYSLGRYGEVTLSQGRLFSPTNIHQPGTTAITNLAAQNALNKITLDDGVNGQNPDNVIYPTGGLTALNTLRTGDNVTSLVGVIDYSFGLYRIIPAEQPTFNLINARTAVPELSNEGNLIVASFNVLNYFNGDGIGGGYPTSRGADNAEEFVRQRNKIISAIGAMNADIIGILEMENDGFGEQSAIQDLINGLNDAAPSDVNYSFVNPNIPADATTGIELLGGDHIKVALIYNNRKVTEIGTAAYLTEFPFEYHNRPPMAQSFELTENGENITVAINHFRSKGCSSTGGEENEDKLDGQGCYNLRRVQAAQATVEWLAQFPTGVEEEDILLIGDLNAYTKEDPVTTIQAAGYTNLTSKFSGEFGYSYSYKGESGTLDHALASSSLTAQVLDLTEWHINADEPTILDYNTEYKSTDNLVSFYNDDAYRASDHDPVILSINLASAAIKGDWDKDGDVDINDVRALMRAVQTRLPIDMAFDLNGDGTVDILDVRFMMTLCTRDRCAA